MRQTFLKADFSASNTLPTSYDADLENFWTQKSNLKFLTVFFIFTQVKIMYKIRVVKKMLKWYHSERLIQTQNQ